MTSAVVAADEEVEEDRGAADREAHPTWRRLLTADWEDRGYRSGIGCRTTSPACPARILLKTGRISYTGILHLPNF